MQNPGQTQLFHKPCQTLLIWAKHDSVDLDNLDDPTRFQPWFVGIDFLEPIFVKAHSGLDIIWICLFTCLSVRDPHLESVMDLTATQFLNCLQRFISWRKPNSIISDSAPQCKLSKQLKLSNGKCFC